MRRAAALLGVVLLATTATAAAGPESSHTGVVRTKRFEIRYRPGSRAAADADRQAAAAERDLDRIAQALETTPKGPFTLWLYDDVWELTEATGTEGNAGFSSGSASHVPYDDEQTRLHELVHVVAYEWPKSGPETRNLFLVEGIANAVLVFVHGVHVHAVAAHYRKAGRLPPLAEMADAADFYAWLRAHPRFDAYDVAASWVRFLLDQHGAAKVKRYYTGTAPKAAFGADLATLEKAWHTALDRYDLRPEVETLLRQRDGEAVAFRPFAEGVPAALAGKPEEWTSLLSRDPAPEEPGRWRREGADLAATNDADEWTACDLGGAPFGDCVVRARFATTGYTPVQVRFGPDNQVMLVQPGTFLFRGEQPVASDPAVRLPLGSTSKEVVVARRGRRIDVWVNGVRALATDAGAEGPRPVGVGIHKGAARFSEVRVRALP
jgi:hypothetical protein